MTLYQHSTTAQGLDFSVPDLSELNVNFPTGAMNGDQDCLNISILDDEALDGNSTFTVSLNPLVSPDTLATPSSSPVTIMDNEGKRHVFGLATW